MPKRIQRQRTRGWRMPEGAIYVGRPTRWGNPFQPGVHTHLWHRSAAHPYDQPCHADVLLELANGTAP